MSEDNAIPPTPPTSRAGSRPQGVWQPPTVEEMQAMVPQYQFECLLGRGGMGAVYKAVQVSLDRPVAIKVLPGDLLDDEDANFVERFKNEARTMAKMNHPAIVNVYDFGETATGLLYFVMEFVNGTDVAKMIESQGRLPPEHALAITAHVCDALQYAHTQGVVHRDIKPANILINMEGAVKVADFGLARADDPAKNRGLTKTGLTMGTPDFVAPEALIMGTHVDGRADLYAIGVMLYNMLTGNIPRGMWTMPSIMLGTDPRFDAIIARAMQTDREQRYQSALEIRRDLDVILTMPMVQAGGQSSAAIPQQVPQKPVSKGPQKPLGKSAKVPVRSSAAAGHSGDALHGQEGGHAPASAATKKSRLGPIIGIAATIVIAAGLYFMFSGGGKREPDAGAAASASPPSPAPSSMIADAPQTPAPSPAPPPDAPALPPLPVKEDRQTIDLLALTDPVLDRVPVPAFMEKNEWKREDKSLVYVSDGKSGKLAAPVAFNSRDYEIEFLAERLSGSERIHVDVPLASGRVLPLVLNSHGRKVLNDKAGAAWGLSRETVHVVIRVVDASGTGDRITISHYDNRENPFVDWAGDLRPLGKDGEPHPAFPNQPVASVFTMRDPYAVRKWELRVFEGEAKVLREAAAAPAIAAATVASTSAASPTAAPGAMTVPPAAPPPTTPQQPPAAPAQSPGDPHLAKLAAGFQARYDTDAQKPFLAAVAALNQSYINNGIARARAAAQQKGALDEVTALDAEKARIQKNEGLPPADLETLPASLKQLRATYRTALARHEAERAKKAVPLYDIYLKALDAYIVELTKANRLDDALKTKELRDEIAAQKPAADAPAVATTKPSPAFSKAGKAEDEPLPISGRSRWHEAALWVLSTGGRLQVLKNSQTIDVQKEADIPPGKFDILYVEIDGANPKAATIKDDDFTRLSGLKELKAARLYSMKVSDAAFAFLATAPAVQSLVITSFPQITDGFFAHLAPLRQLTELQLQDCPQITGVGMEKLSALPVLKILWVPRTTFSDAGARALAGAVSLEQLYCDSTTISDEGAAVLGRLPKLASLVVTSCLRLNGSFLSQWEKPPPSLKFLQLSNNKIDPAAYAAIARITTLETLSVGDMPGFADDDLSKLAPLKNLTSLHASGTSLTGTAFSALQGCKGMKVLHLAQTTRISAEGIAAIAAAFPALEELRLGPGTAVTGDDLRPLAALRSLKVLEATSPAFDDGSLEEASRCSSLESLYVSDCAITAKGLAALKPMKFLFTLSIPGCKQINDEAVAALKNLRLLRSLDIRNTSITDAGFAELKKALPQCAFSR